MDVDNSREASTVLIELMKKHPLWEKVCVSYFSEGKCFGLGCRRQQKRHVAAPPPAGVWRRMKRKR